MLYEGPDLSSGPVSIGRADPAEMRAEYPFSDISADLESCLGSAETRTDVLYFAIRRDGSLVGHILLHGLDPAAGRASVAYHLSRPESRNRGTGTAALGLLLANIDRLAPVSTLEMVSERTNEASRRIAEKCGFEYCGPSPEDGSLVLYEWRGRDEGSVGGEAVGACRRGSPDPCPVSTWEKVYEVVRAIPPGRVSTYGRVAEMAGLPRGHERSDTPSMPCPRAAMFRGTGSSTRREGSALCPIPSTATCSDLFSRPRE